MAEKSLTLEMVARTDVGRERAINEDNFLVSSDYRNADWILPAEAYTDANSIMVVADGMGGLNAGEVASRITVDGIKECLNLYGKLPASDESIRNMLGKAILFAHKKVVTHSAQHAETQGMGSTVVIGLIAHQKIHFAWSGDSRGYVYRQGRLQQLTTDHSYVQSLVDEGKLTPEQAFLHPDSNVILQSIGDADRAPKPDHVSLPLCNDDIFLLCSDGVTSMLKDTEIEALMAAGAGHLAQCADKIVAAANDAGGIDNITVLLSKIVAGASTSVQQTSLPRKKSSAKATGYVIIALLLLLTMGFFVAPMFIRHQSPVVTPAPPVKGPPTAPPGKKDTTIGKKPVIIPPKLPKTKLDTTSLTPVNRAKHKDTTN
jgi:serine/threonine protein phosphatase PrpC